MIEQKGKEVKEVHLSDIIDKLQGKKPFIIDDGVNPPYDYFINFDNIFIYDVSCNDKCNESVTNDSYTVDGLMDYDVEGKHSYFDYYKRLRDHNIQEHDPPSDETV